MPTVADALRAFAPEYLKRFGDRVPIAHRKVLRVLSRCRTGELGNVVYECHSCGQQHWAGRSCGNRHCPSCQFDKTQAWLTKQSARLLPVHYFCVTFTVPSELRMALRANQSKGYKALFDAAHEALRDVGAKTRTLKNCELGYFGVLHTWGRNPMVYHPHLHFVVPGGAIRLDDDGQPAQWRPTADNFLMHHGTLIKVFRAKFRTKLKAAGVTDDVPRASLTAAWKKKSVVDIKPVGNGQAVLKYLAPYVHRVAISDKRIVKVSDTHVTFTMTPSGTKTSLTKTVTGMEFVRGFVQHVLPSGFHKIRYYGPRRLGGRWRGRRERVEPRPRRVASVGRFDNCQRSQRLGAFRVPLSSTHHAIVRRDVAAVGWRVWRRACFFCCALCLANAPNHCPLCAVNIAAAK